MRDYGGYNDAFDFDAIAAACVANLTPGGALVWVVGDQIVAGAESYTSFSQAMAFKRLWLRLHRTLIMDKGSLVAMSETAYFRTREYMFVFSKGKPKAANLLKDKPRAKAETTERRKPAGRNRDVYSANAVGDTQRKMPDYCRRGSIWKYPLIHNTNRVADDISSKSNSASAI